MVFAKICKKNPKYFSLCLCVHSVYPIQQMLGMVTIEVSTSHDVTLPTVFTRNC